MDIVTIIVSAVAGILVWNMFFSKKSTNQVSEASSKEPAKKPYTNLAPFDSYRVAHHLQKTFGTTDLSAMVQYFSKGSDKDPYTNLAPFDSYRVAHHLQETFGTTDLSAMIQYFSNIENKNKETAE